MSSASAGRRTPGDHWPRYDELPSLSGERCAWEVFGPGDEYGTLNWITAEKVVAAAALVAQGRVVNVDLPLGYGTPTVRSRQPLRHRLTASRSGADDSLDDFFLQGSSQWDGLRHVRYREHGYYGGRDDDAFLTDSRDLGIDAWARRGILGRAVLVDVPRYHAAHAEAWDAGARQPITVELLERVLAWQGTRLTGGDVLLVRTGWLRWYDERRAAGDVSEVTVDRMTCAGLDPRPRTAEWLWNARVAAVATDNPAVEALPVRREEGFLHRRLLALLGMPLGELWDLEELARACASSARFEGLLTSSPLNLAGGAGSPANAYVVL